LGGMTALTRYPGAVFIATGTLCLALFGAEPFKRRLADSGLYTLIAAIPVGTFVVWSSIRYPGATPRGVKSNFDLVPQLVAYIRKIPSIVYSWKPLTAEILSFPGTDPELLRELAKPVIAVIALAFVVLVIASISRIRRRIESGSLKASVLRIPTVFLILLAGYLAFFAVAFVATSPTPDVDGRTILPILPALLITLVSIGYVLIQSWPGASWLRIVTGVVVVGSIGGYATISAGPLDRLHQNGSGYTSPEWRKSETMRAAMDLPTDIPLISNEPIAVLFYVDRWPHEMSVSGEPGRRSSFTRYGDGDGEMEPIFRDQRAALILFDTISTEIAGTFKEDTQARLEALTQGLVVAFQGSDGAIYYYPQAAAGPAP
jgi:hypothetical protein